MRSPLKGLKNKNQSSNEDSSPTSFSGENSTPALVQNKTVKIDKKVLDRISDDQCSEPMEVDEKRGEKRCLDADPEYEDVSSHQHKRLRLREDDAKRQVVKKIEAIIREQFSQEMMNKEQEVLLLDERINEAKESLFKLRACLVATYYGHANQQSTVLLNRETKAEPSIHPTLKRHIGKAPARRQSAPVANGTDDTATESGGACRPLPELNDTENSAWTSENLSLSKVDPALKRFAQAVGCGQKGSSRGSRYMEEKSIIIGNVSKFIPYEKREENDPSSHKWMLYVRGPRDQPDISPYVEKVWFFLHPSYAPNDLVEVNRYPFHLTRRGWGEFPVRVQIHFKDKRNKKVDCIHKLKLDQTYTGLSTLGAETKITASLLISSPDSSAPAVNTSKSESKPKTKTKVKEEPNLPLNGVQDRVVSNIDGHVTIKHEDLTLPMIKVEKKSSLIGSKSTPQGENKKEIVVKTEPKDDNETIILAKEKQISLLKDLPKPKDDIFIQCVNSQGSSCFIPQTLFLESQRSPTPSKIPSPVRKRLNPPGSISLLNRPRTPTLSVPKTTGTSAAQPLVTSLVSVATRMDLSGSKAIVVHSPMVSPKPTSQTTAVSTGSSSVAVSVQNLPQVIISPARTLTSAISPGKNVIIPLQVSPVASPKMPVATSAQPIRLPLIRAQNAPILRGMNPSPTSVRPLTALQTNNNAGNRITLLKTAPTSKPIFQVNLATLGKLASAQDPAKSLVTSLLTSDTASCLQNTVAAQLQAQRKATENRPIASSATSTSSTMTGQQILLQSANNVSNNTNSIRNPVSVTVNPAGGLGPAQNVRSAQPQPQLVRANVGGKLVWLQLIPSQLTSPATVAKPNTGAILISPQTQKPIAAATNAPADDASVFHKVAVPRALPPSKKNPNLGRPPKQEERPRPKSIKVSDYDDITSLLRVLVREFPLVAKSADKSFWPYCAKSLREFTLWNVGKKRAAERQRASDLRARLMSVVHGTMFRDQPVPTVRQLVDWCREQGYTPVRVVRNTGKHVPKDDSLSSLSGSDVIVERLVSAHARHETEDDSDVEIVAVEGPNSAPSRPVKKEIVAPQPQKNFYMSADERGDFIGDLVSPLGISLLPYPVAPSVYATVVSGMLYKAVRNMVEDVLRTAHAGVYRQGRPDELTIADVHKALVTQSKLDCLTAAGLGCPLDEDPT